MANLLVSMLPLGGVVIGALLQHALARSSQTRKQAAEARERAYADFLRAVAGVAHGGTVAGDTAAAWTTVMMTSTGKPTMRVARLNADTVLACTGFFGTPPRAFYEGIAKVLGRALLAA